MTEFLASVPVPLVYLTVGLLIGIESLGIPVPGETALIAGAVMAAHHELAVSPWGVAVAASLGAIVGDSIGYAVGARYGESILTRLGRRFPRHLSPDHIAYAEHIFSRYGVLAVFFGRFMALLRILAGPLSGALNLHYPRFLAANALGGILWAGGLTALVVLLGEAAQRTFTHGAWVFLAIFIVLAVGFSRVLDHRLQRNVREYAAQRRERGLA
ncbi:MAG: DedA family protein [Micrococcales bacterium]|nr:DedA family protein [Micrococcales bacterium]